MFRDCLDCTLENISSNSLQRMLWRELQFINSRKLMNEETKETSFTLTIFWTSDESWKKFPLWKTFNENHSILKLNYRWNFLHHWPAQPLLVPLHLLQTQTFSSFLMEKINWSVEHGLWISNNSSDISFYMAETALDAKTYCLLLKSRNEWSLFSVEASFVSPHSHSQPESDCLFVFQEGNNAALMKV